MSDSDDMRAKAIETAQNLINVEYLPDDLRALCAIAVLEERAWTSEIAKLLGWDTERAKKAMLSLRDEGFVNVTSSKKIKNDRS